eukprot:CAMPEP_0195087668 /NCGR_PEP_ID=MMETSP0448-20130528/27449_1 /TAXON_ID=66468 /ORGANISM="Heterocapsa triquestra, Strain CCMP 448" /LENGTH=315 /DNA_ID=CAMNT_0040121261 /DNA_START=24 /DNA_END=971 /DNA_ORIENTATION=+
MTAMAVWLVRLLLPCLLFWIWYRTQANSGSDDYVYPRGLLLAVKEFTEEAKESEVPTEIRRIRMAPDAQVQRVLGRSQGGPGARGPPRAMQRHGSNNTSPPIDAKKAPRTLFADGDDEDAAAGVAVGGGASVEKAVAAPSKLVLSERERAQHEALLNFAAFSHRDEPQRVFLCDGPPPPPPRKALPADVDAAEAKANADAQVVLKGAINPKLGIKSADVTRNLMRQFADAGVIPSEATYSLMVETCVATADLQGASDLLMRMESAGYCADGELLERVMGLYAKVRESSPVDNDSTTASRLDRGRVGSWMHSDDED